MKISSLSVLAGAALFAGCAGQVSTDSDEVTLTSQAVSIIDCQTQAAECLGFLPSISTITTCRQEMDVCMGEVADGVVGQVTDLEGCRDAAVECAGNATGFADAARCRVDFENCASAVVSLPELEFPSVPLPDLPLVGQLPDPGGVLNSANDCREVATECVRNAAGDLSETAMCAEDFTTCTATVLTDTATDLVPELPDLDVVNECRSKAADCVGNAAGDLSAMAECAEQFTECTGVGGGLLGDIAVGVPGAAGSTLLDGLFDGTDCLADLNTCVLGGVSVTDCTEKARMCVGL